MCWWARPPAVEVGPQAFYPRAVRRVSGVRHWKASGAVVLSKRRTARPVRLAIRPRLQAAHRRRRRYLVGCCVSGGVGAAINDAGPFVLCLDQICQPVNQTHAIRLHRVETVPRDRAVPRAGANIVTLQATHQEREERRAKSERIVRTHMQYRISNLRTRCVGWARVCVCMRSEGCWVGGMPGHSRSAGRGRSG
jgi:hypothetical protein